MAYRRELVRLPVWGSNRVRGYVWFTPGECHYAVYAGDRVILYDNGGTHMWDHFFLLATAGVVTIRHMVTAGNKLHTYPVEHTAIPPWRER